MMKNIFQILQNHFKLFKEVKKSGGDVNGRKRIRFYKNNNGIKEET
jgi:hypothetical protein